MEAGTLPPQKAVRDDHESRHVENTDHQEIDQSRRRLAEPLLGEVAVESEVGIRTTDDGEFDPAHGGALSLRTFIRRGGFARHMRAARRRVST